MELKERINVGLFVSLSIVTHVLFHFFVFKNTREIIGLNIVYISTLVSFYFLMRMVHVLITSSQKITKINTGSMFKMMFGHLLFLLFGVSIGVHFMANKIIIALINYIIQIFILGFALRKSLKN